MRFTDDVRTWGGSLKRAEGADSSIKCTQIRLSWSFMEMAVEEAESEHGGKPQAIRAAETPLRGWAIGI